MGAEETAGLTKGERKVYLALAGQGPCTATPIVRATGLQKSAVYFCLDRLIGKGLASYATRNNRKVFEAAPTEKLGEFIDARKNELEEQKRELEKAVENLLASKPKEKSGARVFEGWNGFDTALEDVLNTCEKGDEYCVFSVSVAPNILDRYRRLFGRFHKRRIEKGIRAKILMDEKLRETLGKDREQNPRTKVKYMPSSIFTPAGILMYHDRVLISIAGENPSAVIIQNKEVADSFRAYFDLVWGEEAKTYYGVDGMRLILEDLLNYRETIFIGGSGMVGVRMKEYMIKEFTPRAIAKRHKWRNLARPKVKKMLVTQLPFVETRYLPELRLGPNVIWIWGNKTANVVWTEKPIAFVLENKTVTKSYREYFDWLWKQAKK